MAIQRLTAAYRSRSRPSSTLGAKASTVCPYYLDGDLRFWVQLNELCPVIPVYIGYCAVFKVREEQSGAAAPARPHVGRSDEPADAGLSKLNSMRSWSSRPRTLRHDLPGSVDMLETGCAQSE
jgi:hypothetical protein